MLESEEDNRKSFEVIAVEKKKYFSGTEANEMDCSLRRWAGKNALKMSDFKIYLEEGALGRGPKDTKCLLLLAAILENYCSGNTDGTGGGDGRTSG